MAQRLTRTQVPAATGNPSQRDAAVRGHLLRHHRHRRVQPQRLLHHGVEVGEAAEVALLHEVLRPQARRDLRAQPLHLVRALEQVRHDSAVMLLVSLAPMNMS